MDNKKNCKVKGIVREREIEKEMEGEGGDCKERKKSYWVATKNASTII